MWRGGFELVNEYLARPEKTDVHAVVETTGTLPVYRDIGGTLFLRPDGEILGCDHDSDGPPVPQNDPAWRITALVVAAEKFPDLAVFLPDRPSLAVDCAACDGRGHITVPEIDKEFLCEKCCGLGWLPPAV
jgi:hypothetical protein